MASSPAPRWVQTLRTILKTEHGFGWSIREHRGKVQLTRRFEDDSRSSVSLELAWSPSSQTELLNTVRELRKRMDTRQLSLKEAHDLLCSAPAGSDGQLDWGVVVERFLESRRGLRTTTLGDLRTRSERVLSTLQSSPRPRDGGALMRTYAAQHFRHCPAGGVGRKRQLLDVAALLRFAVNHAGAPDRWLPLGGEAIDELVGHADQPHQDSTPIKPEQLAALLDALKASGKDELYLAVALVGLFGLRPAELGVLKVKEGKLYVGSVKRNASTMKVQKPDRRVLALDLPGREGEGAKAVSALETGAGLLPQVIRNQATSGSHKGVGDAFRQLLDRFPPWVALVGEVPGLTPYGLRHGYAWRGHKAYARAITVRDLAALMGHNPATHHRHYGKWTDEAGLEEAVARAMG